MLAALLLNLVVAAPPARAAIGGYTPYMVYDPGQEKKVRDRRKELRQEREQLRLEIGRLVRGEPEPTPEIEAPIEAPVAEPSRPVQTPSVTRPQLDTAPIIARQARLEAVQTELRGLSVELKALQAAEAQARREENDLLTILLMVA